VYENTAMMEAGFSKINHIYGVSFKGRMERQGMASTTEMGGVERGDLYILCGCNWESMRIGIHMELTTLPWCNHMFFCTLLFS
jgi:hypothetical protein